MVDYDYQPCSRAWTSTTKSYCPTLKKNSHLLLLSTSRLINTSIHGEWLRSLHSSAPNGIVFSATGGAPVNSSEQNLKFTSNFESGNMEIACRKKVNDYELYMKPDTNTKAHFQWFYFKVKNTRKGKRYRFNIKNFTKPFSLHR